MSRPGSRKRRPSAAHAAADPVQWLTGFHPVREALRARRRRLDRLLLREGRGLAGAEELEKLAGVAGVAVERVSAEEIERRTPPESNAQGVALRAGPLPELALEALIELAGRGAGSASRLVALDGVEDPQNLGAVARVAESAGALGLVLTERRAARLGEAASRASAGAIEWLPVARVPNLGRALTTLQENGYWVVAAAPGSGGSLFETEDRLLTGHLVVVLGAEGRGLRRSILEQADHRVEIPMRGRIESLNVSTAGAVLLYDLLRRAEQGDG